MANSKKMPLFDVCCILSKDASTPYMPCSDDDSTDDAMASSSSGSKRCGYDESSSNNGTATGSEKIFFRSGCSGDSSDMVNLVKLYQDSDDNETVKHWMDVYTRQKQDVETKTREVSFACLAEESTSVSQKDASPETTRTKYRTIQSLNRLAPEEGDKEAVLEKCHSADFRKKLESIEANEGMKRCQEMPDISYIGA